MAHPALPAPRRRRVLGGLLDADGWAWAGVKAVFWFVVIILLLGLPPRPRLLRHGPEDGRRRAARLVAGQLLPARERGHPVSRAGRRHAPVAHRTRGGPPARGSNRRRGGSDRPDVHLRRRQRQRPGAQRRRLHLARGRHRQHRRLVGRAGAARGAHGRRVRRPRQLALRHRRVRAGRRPHRHRVQPDRRQRRHPARRVGRGGGGQAARGPGRCVRRHALGRDPAHGRHQRHGRDEHRLEEQAGDRRRPRRMGARSPRCSRRTSTGSRPTPAT